MVTNEEFITAKRAKGEVLLFPKGKIPQAISQPAPLDPESQGSNVHPSEKSRATGTVGAANDTMLQRQTSTFSWKDVVYDIKIKGEPRRILDHVDGWVKPGTLTALMVGFPMYAAPAQH